MPASPPQAAQSSPARVTCRRVARRRSSAERIDAASAGAQTGTSLSRTRQVACSPVQSPRPIRMATSIPSRENSTRRCDVSTVTSIRGWRSLKRRSRGSSQRMPKVGGTLTASRPVGLRPGTISVARDSSSSAAWTWGR